MRAETDTGRLVAYLVEEECGISTPFYYKFINWCGKCLFGINIQSSPANLILYLVKLLRKLRFLPPLGILQHMLQDVALLCITTTALAFGDPETVSS